MFTGLIEEIGEIVAVTAAGDSTRLEIAGTLVTSDAAHGDSICVSGVCLTVVDRGTTADGRGTFTADVMAQTLRMSALASLRCGDAVNLERSVRADARLGGHIVQGHVDGTAELVSVAPGDAWRVLRFAISRDLAPLLVDQGSIAVSGTSLTVSAISPASATEQWFEVSLIPETLAATTLGALAPGDRVNIETDIIARHVARMQEFASAPVAGGIPTPVASPSLAPAHGSAHDSAHDPAQPDVSSIDEAISAIRAGRPVIVADDEDRENEGDVILSAELATAETIAWTVRWSSGLLCAPMTDEIADALELPMMVARNQDARGTAYTVTVDAARGITTGISANDRATTLRALANPDAVPDDVRRPGHVLPLRAVAGGVRARAGHTEAAVELMRLAGLRPVACIAEIVADDGDMMRLPGLLELGDREGVPVITIERLIAYLNAADGAASTVRRAGRSVSRRAETRLPTRHGEFRVLAYRDRRAGIDHLALLAPTSAGEQPTGEALVRVHSECITGEAFGSLRCECGPQLDAALALIQQHGGALIYLRGHEGRGIGLTNKLRAYQLQDDGLDTLDANLRLGLPADARDYTAAAEMLADLGIDRVRLLSNNADKAEQLAEHGIAVAERVPLVTGITEQNVAYLETKRDRMGHLLPEIIAPDSAQDSAPASAPVPVPIPFPVPAPGAELGADTTGTGTDTDTDTDPEEQP